MNKEKTTKQWALKAADFMQIAQQGVYLAAGLAFLFVGIALFMTSAIRFYHEIKIDSVHAFFLLINDLMLLLIIMESMESIVYYLRYQSIPLKPFLHMGMIAGVRKILGAGAKIVVAEELSQEIFDRYIWDLGINAAVILAISLSLTLLNRKQQPSCKFESIDEII